MILKLKIGILVVLTTFIFAQNCKAQTYVNNINLECVLVNAYTDNSFGSDYETTLKVCGSKNFLTGGLSSVNRVYYNNGNNWIEVDYNMSYRNSGGVRYSVSIRNGYRYEVFYFLVN